MFRTLIAVTLAAAPLAAASAQAPDPGQWALGRTDEGCMVYAASAKGTVLSIWGFRGQEKLAFLIQNRSWESLREGQNYDLQVQFDRSSAWPVQAVARRDIDSDGPGFFFTVTPGASETEGARFMSAFASASGMQILSDGAKVDTLALSDSRGAMSALAQCMGEMWSGGASAAPEPERSVPGTTI